MATMNSHCIADNAGKRISIMCKTDKKYAQRIDVLRKPPPFLYHHVQYLPKGS